MSDAQTILKMIEEVSKDDTAKLDEIDARVFFWLNNITLIKPIYWDEHASPRLFGKVKCWRTKELGDVHRWLYHPDFTVKTISSKKVTRSRDALKAIRPKGWHYSNHHGSTEGHTWRLFKPSDENWPQTKSIQGFATEELAELHAIIQAIEYERNMK